MAQWQEMLTDGDQRIARPRQIYQGYRQRELPQPFRGRASLQM
jgi:citrate synthase